MVLIKVVQLILSLSLLVLIHEFGHYIFAKMFGTRVEKFYLFFNPWFSIFKRKIGETEYGLGWIPFGGYVKISGMIDESMDKEQMKRPAEPYEFRSKPAWQRLLIMVGGVMMNIILAFVIYIGLSYSHGESYISNKDVKDGYSYSPLALEIGFQSGDKIISVGGKEYDNFMKIPEAMIIGGEQVVVVDRNGVKQEILIKEEFIPRLLKEGRSLLQLRMPYVIDSVLTNSGAMLAGLVRGDSITSAAGVSARYLDHFREIFEANKGSEIPITYVRDSSGVMVEGNAIVHVSDSSTIGTIIDAKRAMAIYPIVVKNYTFLEAIPAGINRTGDMLSNYFKQLKLIFSPDTEAYKSVGSVIAMGSIFPSVWDWYYFWNITAFFSVILAIMNILPIPALDGGHVMFLIYEVITRRKPSDKFMEYAQSVGMFLLLALMVFALGNDIYKLF